MTSFTHRLVAAAACAALALPVLAQNRPATTPGAEGAASTLQQPREQRAERQAKRQQWQEKRAERQAARLAELKQQLALTEAQQPAWTRFTEALQTRGNFARPDRSSMEKLTTPERIDQIRAMRTQRNATMDARLDATKAFYAELQPEQQRSFDAASSRMMGKGGLGGKRHMRHHGTQGGHMHDQAANAQRSEN